MCDQHIFMVLFDNSKQRLIEFNSSDDFNIGTIKVFLETEMLNRFYHERYTNKDYSLF